MKTIAFNLNNLSFRGTTTAIIDYCKYNQILLNNKSIICYPKHIMNNNNNEKDFNKINNIVEFFHNNYDVIEYDSKETLLRQLKQYNCEYIYYLKAGLIDNDFLHGIKNLIHCVFNHYQPHGHKYVYISEWLRDYSVPPAMKNTFDYVPHIVTMPVNSSKSYKDLYNLHDKYVIGRHGGYKEFDVEFVKEFVIYQLNNNSNITFLFVNTEPFYEHKNIIYLDSFFGNQEKTDYIKSCDMMIQARQRGESFGLALCEGLFHDIPVLSYGGGIDKHNNFLLESHDLIYYSYNDLMEKFNKHFKLKNKNYYENIVKQFSPELVMEKFDRVFLYN